MLGSSRQPSHEEAIPRWITEPHTVASILAWENHNLVQCFKVCLCAVWQRYGQMDRQTSSQTDGCGRVGVLESFVLDFAEFALLSVRGAASALHNGWEASDQILYPQLKRNKVFVSLRRSCCGCAKARTVQRRGRSSHVPFWLDF